MEEFNFSTDEEIEKNRRFRLISLRSQNEPEFRGYKLLPINEKFIRKDTFVQFEKRKIRELMDDEDPDKSTETTGTPKSKKEIKNEIEEARAAGQKYIRKIREKILAKFKFIQSQKTLSDMVIEEQVPNIK